MQAICTPAPNLKKKKVNPQTPQANKKQTAQLMFHLLEKFPVFICTGTNSSSDVLSLVNESKQILTGQKVQ